MSKSLRLFEPLQVGEVAFANRVVMPPMVRGFPSMSHEVADTGGEITEAVVEHYVQRARGGAGCIIVEATAVDAEGRAWHSGLNAYADTHLLGLTQLARAIRDAGAVAGIQLVHGGPQGSSKVTGFATVGPSEIAPSRVRAAPRALSVDEIAAIELRFAEAAARCAQAGFQMVEVHGAHGFLLDSFLSPVRNRRSDEYGGALAGRMRFLVETCARVCERLQGSALVGCRISLFNHLDEGLTQEDLAQLVHGLEAAGLDLLHISTDGAFKRYFGTHETLGQLVKGLTGLPVIVAGGLKEPAQVERFLSEGHADFAAVGRAMLKDPQWAQHAREALEA